MRLRLIKFCSFFLSFFLSFFPPGIFLDFPPCSMISLSFPPLLSASSSSSSSSLTLLSSRVSPPFFFLFALLHLHLPPFCLSPLLIYIVRLLRPLFAPISLHLTPSSSSPHLTSPHLLSFLSSFSLTCLFPLLFFSIHPSLSLPLLREAGLAARTV